MVVEEELFTGGGRVKFEVFKTVVRDDDGVVIGVTGCSTDITRRQEAAARIERLTQLYQALSDCNQAIAHSGSQEELLPKVCSKVVEFGGMKMAWIGMVNEADSLLLPVAQYGAGTDYLKEIKVSTDIQEAEGRGPAGTSIRENRPVWCQDFQNDPTTGPWHQPGARFGWQAVASLPLRKGEKVIGAMLVYSDKMHLFDAEVRKLLEQLANDISFAIDSFESNAKRKAMECALRESESTMRYIVKHDPNALAVLDSSLRFLAVSDRFLQDYNVREEQIIGRHHYDVFPDIPQKWRDVHQRCLAGAVERNDDDFFSDRTVRSPMPVGSAGHGIARAGKSAASSCIPR